jgi:hypothetical protein
MCPKDQIILSLITPVKSNIDIETFRGPSLFLDDFFSPSFAAFPWMLFCGKIRNKNNEKRNIYGFYVVYYFFILFN